MADNLFQRFAALHVPGDPVVLFNAWDAGSAAAVARSGAKAIAEQAERIAAARRGAGQDFFINVRTDLFLKADSSAHDQSLADAAIERGRAYAEAGVNGFFIPGLGGLELVERICRAVDLPVNAMHFPGAPSRAEWAAAGIARVSHGPFPFMAMQQWLEGEARAALA